MDDVSQKIDEMLINFESDLLDWADPQCTDAIIEPDYREVRRQILAVVDDAMSFKIILGEPLQQALKNAREVKE